MRSNLVSKITISEDRTLDIFKNIGSAQSSSNTLITRLKLIRKQYYSRICKPYKSGFSEKTEVDIFSPRLVR